MHYLDKGIGGFVFISLTGDDITQMGLKTRLKKNIISLIASILCEANGASHQPTNFNVYEHSLRSNLL